VEAVRAQPFALSSLLLVGAGVGFLIGGVPGVSPELRTTVAAGAPSSLPTSTTAAATSSTGPPPSPAPAQAAGLHAPEEVAVVVLNGASTNGAAAEITNALAALGYVTLPPGNTDPRPQTVVLHAATYEADAAAIAAAIHLSLVAAPLTGDVVTPPEGASVVVVLGADYAELRSG
jgi:hypothetical protein